MPNEATNQSMARIQMANWGWMMWRNNKGVLLDSTGRPVRYGLANDTKAVGERFRSADTVGIRPVLITPEMVGMTIGQFASVECKASGWREGNDPHSIGQRNWVNLVRQYGGFAAYFDGDWKL